MTPAELVSSWCAYRAQQNWDQAKKVKNAFKTDPMKPLCDKYASILDRHGNELEASSLLFLMPGPVDPSQCDNRAQAVPLELLIELDTLLQGMALGYRATAYQNQESVGFIAASTTLRSKAETLDFVRAELAARMRQAVTL